ncbi:hypothetical protein BH10PSE2_BH10PSE2_16490 [soil metagenome]
MSMLVVALAALSFGADPEGVVVTAPSGDRAVLVGAEAPAIVAVPSASSSQAVTPHGLNTAQQIDRWIGKGAPGSKPFENSPDPCVPADDRKIHGSVSASIGTNDYRDYSAEVSIPFGETGRVNLAYSESRNNPYAYGSYGAYGYGPYGYGTDLGSRGFYDGVGGGYGRYGATGHRQTVSVGAEIGRDSGRRETPVWDRLDLQGRDTTRCEVAVAD